MKKSFTLVSYARRLLMILALVAISTMTYAGSDGYFDYYIDLEAYPTGAGTVYADAGTYTVPEPDNIEFFDFTTPAEKVTIKYCTTGSMMGYNAHAVPADGWIFAGFSGATRDANGDFVFSDEIKCTDNPGWLSVTSTTQYDDETTALTGFPLLQDTVHYAIFTHVLPYVADGQASLGSVSISKVCNYIGDKVTLSATPNADDATAKFEYWINKATGEKITANPVELTVSDTVRYEAHFTSDNAIPVSFPENGGVITFYNESGVTMPASVKVLNFNYQPDYYSDWSGEMMKGDSLCYDEGAKRFYQVPDTTLYSVYGAEPYIMWGKGEVTFVKNDYGKRDQTNNLLQWSGAEGKKVGELAVTSHYYSVDTQKNEFHLLASDAVIAPNTVYLAMPNVRYEIFGVAAAPETIYWTDSVNEGTGIEDIAAGNRANGNARQGIYTVSGQKLERITKSGLYIVNGEKRFYLVK